MRTPPDWRTLRDASLQSMGFPAGSTAERDLLRAAIDSMLDPFVVLTAVREAGGRIVDFVFTEANAAACAFNGLAYDRLIGVPLLGQHPAAATTDLFERYVHVVETGEPLVLDNWSYPQDMLGGRVRRYDVRAVKVGDGLSQTWRDVTDTLSARLAASEELFRLAFDNSAVGMCLVSPEGRLVRVNAALCEMLGRSQARLLENTWQELTHPDDLDADLALVDDVLHDRIPGYRLLKRFLKPDGTLVWGDLCVSCVRNTDRTIRHFVSQIVDVTEQVEAREALAESEARYRTLTEAAGDAIVTAGLDGTIIAWNTAAVRMFGYTEKEAVGRPVTILMPERYAVRHDDHMRRMRESDERHITGQVVELTAVRRDGSEFPVELSLAEWQAAGGHYVTTIVRDVTERALAHERLTMLNDELEERAERRTQELLRASTHLESFAYSIAHDLRTPLRAIDGYAYLLAEDHAAALDDPGRELLGRIRSRAQHAGHLIDALLSLPRIQGDRPGRELVDITALVAEVAHELRAQEPGHHVHVDVVEGLTVWADRDLVEIVLENLLGNAWKFSSGCEPAHIEVGETRRDGERGFFVRDDGVGFEQQYVDKLFQPFQRLHTTDDFPGVGIGLATVQRIVETLGGHCWAEGDPGAGATFFVTFPERHGA